MVFIKLFTVVAESGLMLNTTPNLKQKMYNSCQLLSMAVDPFPCGSMEKRSKAFTLAVHRQKCDYSSCIFANLQMAGSQKKTFIFLLDKWSRVVLPLDSLRTFRDMYQLFWKLHYCFYCSPYWGSSGICIFRRHIGALPFCSHFSTLQISSW